MAEPTPQSSDAAQRERAALIAEAALDKKAEHLVALDVRNVTSYTDTFVLATGNSDRHTRSIADAVRQAVAARGEKPLGVEGYDEGRWVLIDLGDVIVHVFQSDVREEYDLERLWSDAPPIPLDAVAAAAS
jgi:ribosome-associated protein